MTFANRYFTRTRTENERDSNFGHEPLYRSNEFQSLEFQLAEFAVCQRVLHQF